MKTRVRHFWSEGRTACGTSSGTRRAATAVPSRVTCPACLARWMSPKLNYPPQALASGRIIETLVCRTGALGDAMLRLG